MAPLAERSQVLISAVFRLMIKMRHRQHHNGPGKWMALTMPSLARAARYALTATASTAANTRRYDRPIRWIPAAL